MTLPRHCLVSLDQTSYYHCISRCVRRAFLCGRDRFTGKDFSHRRRWIEARIHQLAGVFAIDVLAYAVMSNHYHLVLRIDAQKAERWSDHEVETHWSTLFRLPHAYVQAGEAVDSPAARALRCDYIACWRQRLANLGWLMRCINEPLARLSNNEDGCKGRFWEGRYRSQALLDEAAVLKCMAYVDLNPIRAGIARLPERSRFTSIHARLQGKAHALAAFADCAPSGRQPTIPYDYQSYLELVDWSGRLLREDKAGAIPATAPPIIERLGLQPVDWRRDLIGKRTFRRLAMGSVRRLLRYRAYLGQVSDAAGDPVSAGT